MSTTMNRIIRRIGMNIRRRRTTAKLTQAALAKKSGLSLRHVSAIERGERGGSLLCLVRLAKALRTTTEMFCQCIDD